MHWVATLALSAALALAFSAAPMFAPSPARAETPFALSIDCDVQTSGVQSLCPAAAGTTTVNIVLTNHSGWNDDVRGFQFNLIAQAQPNLNPTGPPAIAAEISSSGGWNCTVLPPVEDQNPDLGVADSFLACIFMGGPAQPPIAHGASVTLATMTYATTPGASSITVENVSAFNSSGYEWSCHPAITNEATCNGATFVPPTFAISIDCDIPTPGVQSSCAATTGARTVNVVLTNHSGSDDNVSAFQFNLIAQAQPNLSPTAPPAIAAEISSSGGWDCTMPPAIQDQNPDPLVADSSVMCRVTGGLAPPIAHGASVTLATMTYTTTTGASSVTVENFSVFNSGGTEIGSCNPVITNEATCSGVTFVPPAFTLSLDCQPWLPDVQSSCPAHANARTANVVLTNSSGGAFEIAGFQFDLIARGAAQP